MLIIYFLEVFEALKAGGGKRKEKITAPNGCKDYVNGTFISFGGTFNFSYLLSGANGGGTYLVKVGGDKIAQPATTSFVYTPPETPGGGGSQQYTITVDNTGLDGVITPSATLAAAGGTRGRSYRNTAELRI